MNAVMTSARREYESVVYKYSALCCNAEGAFAYEDKCGYGFGVIPAKRIKSVPSAAGRASQAEHSAPDAVGSCRRKIV